MPKKNTEDKLHSSKLKNKIELAKLRSERNDAILKLKDKIKIATLKEEKIRAKIKEENLIEKSSDKKNKVNDRVEMIKFRQSVSDNKKSITEGKKKQKEKNLLLKKEVKLQELSAKRDNKRKVLLLKENLKESIQNNKKLIVEAKFKAKNDLLLQKNDLKNSRNSKRLERQQQRESNLKKAKNEKQNKINQKREIIEAYKIKKLKFKSGIIASRKKDSIKINTLTKDVKHQEYIISKQKNKLHDEILDISKKSKQNIENIEDKYELKNISFDVRHEENIEKSKINNVNISIVQMFGKQTMKKVSKAEEAAIELHAKKYSQAERLEIENFREIVEAEEPVHIKSLIKYVFVLKKLNLSKEKIHELYINQLCSLLFGETIQFGSGYLRIAKKKNNKTLFSENLKYGKNKEVFTIFPKQGNKEFNKLVSEKLNNGSVIKIASGLLVYKNKKTIKVLADTNYKGA